MNYLLCVENGEMVKYAQLSRLASAWLLLAALATKVASVSGSYKGSYNPAPFAKPGSYILTVAYQASPISLRFSVY